MSGCMSRARRRYDDLLLHLVYRVAGKLWASYVLGLLLSLCFKTLFMYKHVFLRNRRDLIHAPPLCVCKHLRNQNAPLRRETLRQREDGSPSMSSKKITTAAFSSGSIVPLVDMSFDTPWLYPRTQTTPTFPTWAPRSSFGPQGSKLSLFSSSHKW